MFVSFTVSLCHMLAVLCYLLAFVSFTGVVLFTGVTIDIFHERSSNLSDL